MISLTKGRAALIVRGAGLALTFASLIFVGVLTVETANLLAEDFTTLSFIAMIGIEALIYALLCCLVGFSWVLLVQSADQPGALNMRDGLIAFARSQIFKYLPSNVLHLIGRYGMAHRAGASHTSLLFATAAETGLLLLAASTVAVVFGLPFFIQYVIATLAHYWVIGVVAVTLLFLIGASLYWLMKMRLLKAKLAWTIASVFSLYLCFFLLNGTLLWVLVAASNGADIERPLFIVGVAAAAWAGGFVIPGAPAGLGVREVILTSGLMIVTSESTALAAAVGYRVVTLVGDIVVALVGFVTRRMKAR